MRWHRRTHDRGGARRRRSQGWAQPQRRPPPAGQGRRHRSRVVPVARRRQAQRRGERILLWPRQFPTSIHDRAEQIVQPGVGDLRLGLESLGPKHAETRGCRGPVQQRRLADPRFSAKHERAAPTVARGVEQRRDPRLFDRTPDEHGVMILMRRWRLASSRSTHRYRVLLAPSRRRLRRGPRTQRARTGGVPGLRRSGQRRVDEGSSSVDEPISALQDRDVSWPRSVDDERPSSSSSRGAARRTS